MTGPLMQGSCCARGAAGASGGGGVALVGSSILPGAVARGTRGRLGHSHRSRGTPSHRQIQMSVLAPAVGAVLAAVVESSVLTHLQVGSVKPDLVFAVGIAVAMVLGFDSGMAWAFSGGLTLDLLLPGRALGSTALTLVLLTGLALLIARAMWPPRLAVIALTALALTPLYQYALLAVLALTAAVAFSGLALTDLALVAVLNAVIAALAVVVVRALDLRFGERERLAW